MAIYILAGSTHFTLFQFLCVVGWLFTLRLSTMDTTHLEQLVAQAVQQAFHAAQLTRKEAAALMRIDESQLGKQLRGEPGQHISLTRLMRLTGTGFWIWFGPTLLLIVARERYAEFAETLMFFGKRRYQPLTNDYETTNEEQQQRRA